MKQLFDELHICTFPFTILIVSQGKPIILLIDVVHLFFIKGRTKSHLLNCKLQLFAIYSTISHGVKVGNIDSRITLNFFDS